MGRNAQPISILRQTGKKHLTKAEIEYREKTEIKIGTNKLVCPDFVKNDIVAFAKWKELVKIYKDFPNVSSSDVGMIAKYCVTYSQYLEAIENKKRFEARYNGAVPIDDIVKLDGLINKKLDLLLKMEDRLFLNPLAKIKNVPKKEEVKKDPLAERGFGNV